MKIKIGEANNLMLDYLVAKIDGIALSQAKFSFQIKTHGHLMAQPGFVYSPTSNWAQGGPIIERERIELNRGNDLYFPSGNENGDYYEPLWIAGKLHGQTPLIAAMRCYVASKLGDEVDVPDELLSH